MIGQVFLETLDEIMELAFISTCAAVEVLCSDHRVRPENISSDDGVLQRSGMSAVFSLTSPTANFIHAMVGAELKRRCPFVID